MTEGYKHVWIKVSTYKKLKELSEKSGKGLSRLIDELVSGVGESIGFDENAIRKIVREEIFNALKDLEPMLYNTVKKAISELKEKKKPIEVIREAFLGFREPLILKKLPIQVSKGNIFIETKEKPNIDVSQFKAEIIVETNEKGEIIGYSIVPSIGFEDMSLEEWFDKYGAELFQVLPDELKV